MNLIEFIYKIWFNMNLLDLSTEENRGLQEFTRITKMEKIR